MVLSLLLVVAGEAVSVGAEVGEATSGEAAEVRPSLEPLVAPAEGSGSDVAAVATAEAVPDAAEGSADLADEPVEAAFVRAELPVDDAGACVASARSSVFGEDAGTAFPVGVDPPAVC